MTLLPAVKQVPARWHGGQRSKGAIKWVVLHTAETPERDTTAESVAAYFAGGTVKASAHYCVDNNSVCQGVQDFEVAWAAPGANATGLQIGA